MESFRYGTHPLSLCFEAADQKLNPTPGQRGLLLLPPTKEGKWFSHQKEKRKRGDFISILDTPPSLSDFISISEVIIRGLKITTLRPPRRWFFLLRPAISYWSPDETCKTVSTCASVEEDQGTHVFDIFGYSKHRGMGHDLNSHIRSGFFDIGGYNWAIVFFPDGFNGYGQDYISVYLMLVSSRTKLRASCDIRLVDQYTGCSFSVHKTGPRIFNPADFTRIAPHTPCFIRRDKIEGSAYLRDDRLTIECVVTVFKKPHVTETKSFPIIDMPPADMTEHVAKLLEEKKGFDVSFIVGGETIEAHRFVLAMRSPVFKAEFYGSMREARPGQCITVKDMQPAVLKALLHFIYTDSLPSGDDTEMVRLLLVAVDRYAMDRLKLVCQSILCEDLNKDTVETTLALADQYNCLRLKDACLQFMELSGFKDLKATCTSFIEDALEKRRKKS